MVTREISPMRVEVAPRCFANWNGWTDRRERSVWELGLSVEVVSEDSESLGGCWTREVGGVVQYEGARSQKKRTEAQRHRRHCATRKREQTRRATSRGIHTCPHKTALPLVELRLPQYVDTASQNFAHAEPNQPQRRPSNSEALAQQHTCDKILGGSWTGTRTICAQRQGRRLRNKSTRFLLGPPSPTRDVFKLITCSSAAAHWSL